MARTCPVSKRTSLVGGKFSNRTRATQFNPTGKVRKQLNMQKKKIYIPELKKSIILTLSTRAIKTINKNGAYADSSKSRINLKRKKRRRPSGAAFLFDNEYHASNV